MSDEIAKIRARWTGNVTPSTLVDHGKKDALALLAEVERLRAALEWYATADYQCGVGDNGSPWPSGADCDGGERAREALKGRAE